MEERVKKCTTCKQAKPFSEFHKSVKGTHGKASQCRPCKAHRSEIYRSKNKDKIAAYMREYNLKPESKDKRLVQKVGNYGLSREQFDFLLEQQDYRCGICQQLFDGTNPAVVDHDHVCCPPKPSDNSYSNGRNKSCGKCVRGLLCRNCNAGLGMFNDSVVKLLAAIRYLNNDLTGDYPIDEVYLSRLVDIGYSLEG